jgi:uncharacterized protein (TIGR02453 family)
MAHFTDATFDFLFELDVHNSKEWMDENRHRYESDVKQPMFRFVEALAEPMHKAVSKHLVVVPKIQRGSVFQQHRDTRFSHDKRPYKSNCGANFRHAMADGDVAAPGLYLHLEPGNCFMGGGIYRPPNPVLTKIREAVVADRGAWSRARNSATSSGYELGGDSLTRASSTRTSAGAARRHLSCATCARRSQFRSEPIALWASHALGRSRAGPRNGAHDDVPCAPVRPRTDRTVSSRRQPGHHVSTNPL